MKRYWLTASLLLLAISGPVLYYGLGQNNTLPEFKLEALEGDENEAAGITLEGSYRTNVYYSLKLDEQGSEYSFERQSSLQQLNGGRYWLMQQPDLRRLVQEHRSFMRGKTDPNGFYEDDQMVVYAEVLQEHDQQSAPRMKVEFHVEILNKETDKTTTYKQVAEADRVSSIYVEDVQFVNDQLMIMVNFWDVSNSKAVYAMSIPEGKLTLKSELGDRQPSAENAEVQSLLRSADIISEPSSFVMLETRENPNRNSGEEAAALEQWDYKNQFSFYSYSSNELTELPQELVKLRAYGSGEDSLQDNMYYYGQLDSGNLKLSRYAIEIQQLEINDWSYTKEQLGADEFIRVKISGERVFLLLRTSQQYEIAIFSLTDGKVLYRGKALQVGKNAVSEEDLHLNFELRDISVSNKSL